MLRRLPYRIQIPLGLSLAVLTTALMVTAISAQVQAVRARQETLTQLDRAVVLLKSQVRPLLAADDTWRVFSLLKDTAGLVPGASSGHARLAILESDGAVVAASDPEHIDTGSQMLGQLWKGVPLSAPGDVLGPQRLDIGTRSVAMLEPIKSEDGQTVGFVFTEVDSEVFAPDWRALFQTAMEGIALAFMLLVPIGWWLGQRMTRPVGRLVNVIERIGHEDTHSLRHKLPKTPDPELSRIGGAIDQLMVELEGRKAAEDRALSAERLAAVGRMTAAVAHEINNPLAGLLTATQTLRLHGSSQDIRDKTVDLLGRGLLQIKTTVAALLPQARVEDRVLEPGDLDDIVTLVNNSASKLKASIETRVEVESALRVPSAPLRQVMLNLILNAIKAAGERGHIHAHLRADESRVCFCVSNTGVALTEEKFQTILASESERDPRGFGLWVCHELASHLQGEFKLSPNATGRTCLVFSVPNREKPESIP